jgi:2-dehydropantoate 2-reductase
MRVGVVGAGSIGCYVGGRLVAAGAADVVFVGRERLQREIAAHGLTVKDFDGEPTRVAPEQIAFATDVGALADCDAILCCVKSAQTEDVARQLAGVARSDAVIASLQNGVRNPDVLRSQLGDRRVLGGIVDFNVVSRGDGLFHRTTSGPISLEYVDEPVPRALAAAIGATGIPIKLHPDLVPHQWTKLLVNLNNSVSALSDAPTREILLSPTLRRVVAAIVGEAHGVLRAAKIKPARLRGVPVGWMPAVLRLPTPLVRLVTRAQMKVAADSRSSMWEDLQRGRPTEVDYLNGEIVRLAERTGVAAPINRKIVELVHDAERAGPGSPKYSGERLLAFVR